jgi:hypothetical protein
VAQAARRAPRGGALPRSDIIRRRADELAELESQDNGMTAMGAQQIIKVSVDMLN